MGMSNSPISSSSRRISTSVSLACTQCRFGEYEYHTSTPEEMRLLTTSKLRLEDLLTASFESIFWETSTAKGKCRFLFLKSHLELVYLHLSCKHWTYCGKANTLSKSSSWVNLSHRVRYSHEHDLKFPRWLSWEYWSNSEIAQANDDLIIDAQCSFWNTGSAMDDDLPGWGMDQCKS